MIQINHFIQVKGKENVGKTTIIDWCFLKLLENTQLKSLKYFENGDFVAVIEYKGNIIAFVSAGDIARVVKANYEVLCKMYQGEIEVCVFATRTRGDGVHSLKEILKQNNKENFDEVLENQEQVGKTKKEIINYLQEQSKILVNLIEQYLQGSKQ